jgi:hypothetical protein
MVHPVQTLLRQSGKVLAVLSLSLVPTGSIRAQEQTAVQTIVSIRHGEKPKGGFGQLTCQGFNRALALAPIIARSFGKPDAIFAPNPSHSKMDDGTPYDYVRPLATVEPTAILFGVPVDVSLDLYDKSGLVAALEKRRARDHSTNRLRLWCAHFCLPMVPMQQTSSRWRTGTVRTSTAFMLSRSHNLEMAHELRSHTSTRGSTGNQTRARTD